ncbi:UbiD family decarboxylase [Dactylosporangium sp. NPDC006015]|uniref:UbiD family decarboxylase n=1 Tax=Dactylosporangium sp. NPDC006015 TaxID=3154576 RepID=UPI00339F0D2A
MTLGQDLRGAFETLRRHGKAVVVAEPVGWEYEAAAVLWELAHGPAVRFDDVPGYRVPLVGNLLNTRDKLACVLGVDDERLGEVLAAALDSPVPPAVVDDAPCQEVVVTDGIDLTGLLPIPAISERDGGRYLSAGVLLCAPPGGGRQNLAIARLQVQGPDRLGVNFAPTHSWQFLQEWWARGEPMPVAVALGCHPAVAAASQLLVPFDEAHAAGALFGEPLRMVRGRTVDVLVPAEAEIVIEALLHPGDRAPEGPFGEFPGLYAPMRDNPVLRVTAVTHRRDPWLTMIVGGNHPEHLVTGAVAREATLLRAVRAVVPSTRRVVLTEAGSCRFHAVIAIEQRNPGEARLAMLAAFSTQDLIKHVTVVDDDIDPADPRQVEWAVATRMRAHEDLLVVPGMKSNPVDPMSVGRTISKLGIDATRPLGADPERSVLVDVPAGVRDQVRARWSELFPDAGAS